MGHLWGTNGRTLGKEGAKWPAMWCSGENRTGPPEEEICVAYCPVSALQGRFQERGVEEILMKSVERVRGIEPLSSAWEAEVLPLNNTRTSH